MMNDEKKLQYMHSIYLQNNLGNYQQNFFDHFNGKSTSPCSHQSLANKISANESTKSFLKNESVHYNLPQSRSPLDYVLSNLTAGGMSSAHKTQDFPLNLSAPNSSHQQMFGGQSNKSGVHSLGISSKKAHVSNIELENMKNESN
jgi:hypothetical protein